MGSVDAKKDFGIKNCTNKGVNNIKLKDFYRDISMGTYIINVIMENKTLSNSIIITN